jgi:SAM-dependent methyltransferase
MTSFEKYAEYYDLLYSDKDYEGECDYLESIFKKYSKKPVKTLCDAGCGSGRYAIPLAKRGYQVTGVDLSADMIKSANKTRKGNNPEYLVSDIRKLKLNKKFDAVISMFAVIGYITDNKDLKKTLQNIGEHLETGGLFVFDVWNGLAVIRHLPEQRIKEAENDKLKNIRFASPQLRASDHGCEVNYKVLITDKKSKTLDEINEKHIMRFYFPQELRYYLEEAGFDVLKVCPFKDLNGEINENTWNMSIIAQKK